MKLIWPSALFLLGLIPILIMVYLWMIRRRRRYAVRYSSLSLVRGAVPAYSRLRRYLPPFLFLLALTSLVFGMARPSVIAKVPAGRATIMLVLDVSSSMLQVDILPSRLAAAKSAALSFIERQQAHNQIGIVAFASIAQLIQSPSTESEALELAIQNLTTGRGTAIGSGILTALDTIAEYNSNVAASTRGNSSDVRVTPLPPGTHAPDIIVLLTDGVYNAGIDPFEAAQQAVERGVRVFTIGYGTNSGIMERGNNFFGGGGRGIDEASLKEIASMTGGDYFTATSASELQKVFTSLPTVLFTKEQTLEISVLFAGIGALLLFGAVLLGQLWHPLP